MSTDFCAHAECQYHAEHYHCPSCGVANPGQGGICSHHHLAADEWAASNRIMCDFLHRGVVPPRVPEAQRVDDFWAAAVA